MLISSYGKELKEKDANKDNFLSALQEKNVEFTVYDRQVGCR